MSDSAIEPPPAPDLNLVVVIPCHNEPNICLTLQSLANCHLPNQGVEVIVVINSSSHHHSDIHAQNQRSRDEMMAWKTHFPNLAFELHIITCPDLPRKHAGVGLARRIGMDEAAHRLNTVGNPMGLIVNLDADCTVAPNYFQAVENHFATTPDTPGASLWFEHPLTGELAPEIYQAIAYYELFLRYHINGQRFAGLPCAFQTIGSAMAVRAQIYQEQGGMNRRKAGEDFYFLHKVIGLGQFSEINNTAVYPSPRVSDRVPFGTGRAVGDWLKHRNGYPSYSHHTYLDLKVLVDNLPNLYSSKNISAYIHSMSTPLQAYLESVAGEAKLTEIFANSASESSFRKRFFHWFNGFRVMKCAHFLRDEAYGEKELVGESQNLLNLLGEPQPQNQNEAISLLKAYRALDRRWAA